MNQSQRYEMAREKVRKLKGFWIHLGVYLIVNACLAALNLVKEPDKLWFHWVLIGWGIGVLAHGFLTFGGTVGKNWEERKIKEMMEKP